MSLICYRISIIFAMIVIGFVCSKTKILPFESNKYLIMLIMNITSPCLLITSIASKELTDSTIAATVQMLAASLIYFIAGMFVGRGAGKADTGAKGGHRSVLHDNNMQEYRIHGISCDQGSLRQ